MFCKRSCIRDIDPRLPKLWAAGATAANSRSATDGVAPGLALGGWLDMANLGRGVIGRGEPLDRIGDDVDHLLVTLEPAADERERRRSHGQAAALVDRRRHDHVHHPELVLEQHEDDALGRRWALASDDQTGHPHLGPISEHGELVA